MGFLDDLAGLGKSMLEDAGKALEKARNMSDEEIRRQLDIIRRGGIIGVAMSAAVRSEAQRRGIS